jgi:hypothetical protein
MPANNLSSSDAIAKAALIEARLANEKKSTFTAYLLWFFFGFAGIHYFYLSQRVLGAVRLIAAIALPFMMSAEAEQPTIESSNAMLVLGVLAIWWVVDLFMIPCLIKKATAKRRKELRADMQ